MKKHQARQEYVPLSMVMPKVAADRISEEAKRRRISTSKLLCELIDRATSDNSICTKDVRLEKHGFSYADVDWENKKQAYGVIVGEYVMRYLPPSRKEWQ